MAVNKAISPSQWGGIKGKDQQIMEVPYQAMDEVCEFVQEFFYDIS